MTDDDDFILDELASAYLDDEVTADERAAIEADPRALARVATLRAVRVTLQADLGQLDDDRLEAALATALAAHGVAAGGVSTAAVGLPTGPSSGSPVPPLDLAAARRRRASRIWKPVLAVAGAAAIGVGAISGVANLAADSGGDDSASEEAVTMAASDAPDSAAGTALDSDAAAGAAPAESEAASDPALSGGDATRETISEIGVADVENTPLLSTQPAAESTDESADDTTGTTETASIQAAVPAPALTTEQQLAAFSAEARTAAPAPAPSTSSPCPDLGYPTGPVIWQGTPGELYVSVPTDEDSPALATVATVDCVILVSVLVPVP